MKMLVAAALVLTPTVALAVPPTVSPSPGYDRALAESRRAREAPPVVVEPAIVKPKVKKHRR